MGISTDAILAYGWEIYNDGDAEWLVPTAGISEWWAEDSTDEYGDEEGFADQLERALKNIPGVSYQTHCHHDHAVYMLVAFSATAWRGQPTYPNLAELEAKRVTEGWDNKLRHAATTLGLEPATPPAWLLASYQG